MEMNQEIGQWQDSDNVLYDWVQLKIRGGGGGRGINVAINGSSEMSYNEVR